MVHHRTACMRGAVFFTAFIIAILFSSTNTLAAERFETPVGFKVSETGAATFNIPIEVPPGTAGMAPSISLNYSSQGDDGLVGMGWSLTGLSAIYRCGRTLIQDGSKETVTYTSNDPYCLDGQRLVVVSGTYGADGAVYRTERESFTQIISYGTTDTGPVWFKAWTKAGQIMEFGNTANSAIQAIGKSAVRVWAVNKISDNVGNYLTVNYFEGTNGVNYDYRPTSISYTWNTNFPTQTAASSVSFIYETRSDVTPLYQAGSEIKNNQRLINIQTRTRIGVLETIKDYRLKYEPSPATQRSRLISITECDGPVSSITATCLPATTITWQSSNNPFAAPTNFNLSGYELTHSNKTYGHSMGDFNSDGKTDLLRYSDTPSANALLLSNGNGSFTQSGAFNIKGENLAHSNKTQGHSVGDFNGDGKTDILRFADDPSLNKLFLSNGDGSFTVSAYFNLPGQTLSHSNMTYGHVIGDFNGDGRSDILRYSDTASSNALFLSSGDGTFTESGVFNIKADLLAQSDRTKGHSVGDFNGDGKTDILKYSNIQTENKLYLSNGDGSFTVPSNFTLTDTYLAYSTGTYGHSLGDFNGDGKADILRYSDNSADNDLYLSNGDGSFALPKPMGTLSLSDGTYGHSLGDFNADGKTDILRYSNSPSENILYLSKGDGTFSVYANSQLTNETLSYTSKTTTPTTITYTRTKGSSLGDFNGDGKTDILKYSDIYSENKLYWEQNAVANDLVQSLTTGLGTTTSLVYKPLTDSTVYTKSSTARYPYLDLQAPLYVVATSTVPDGIGSTRSTNYVYASAKAHLRGGGFLGFGQFDVTDAATGIKTSTVFRQDYPYQGLPVSVTQTQDYGGLLKSIANTWSFTTYTDTVLPIATGVGSKHHFPAITATLEKTFDLVDGELLTQLGTTTQYDTYGNTTKQTTVTNDNHSKTLTNTYAPANQTKWFIAQLQRSALTSTSPDTLPAPPPVITPPPPLSPTVHIAALDAVANEGNQDPTAFTFVISRDGDTTGSSSVNWTVAGSGINIVDKTDFFGGSMPAGIVNFEAGQIYLTFTVNVQGDTEFEPDEGFTVTLSNPANAILGIPAAAGIIRNDERDPYVFWQTLSANTQNYNLKSAAIASGWDQIVPLIASVTINTGIVVGSSSTGAYAFDTGAGFPEGSTLAIINNGYIVGAGGNGGAGAAHNSAGTAGTSGGPALRTQYATTITNNSIIGGGGGGGGGGGITPSRYLSTGGNGGGGAGNFVGSPNGSLTTGGAGGSPTSYGGVGGGGGDLGVAGVNGSGSSPYPGGAGGAPGAAIQTTGNNSITWVTRGNVLGPQINVPPPPLVNISALAADRVEGNSGTAPFTFSVSRSGTTTSAASVNWAVTGYGTNAADAADFNGGMFPSGVLNFSAGQVSQTLTINVESDTQFEAGEDFAVTLSNPANMSLGTHKAVASILNDDAAPLPTISITAPLTNNEFGTLADISLSAVTAVSDGSIAKVEIFANDALLATIPGNQGNYLSSTSWVFYHVWRHSSAGVLQVKAKVTDDLGRSTISEPITITVFVTEPPVVSLTAPANNSTIPSPTTITATASDSDGTISKVAFYSGIQLLGTSTTAPYSYSWRMAAGTHVLTAKATDNLNVTTTSEKVTVTVESDVDLVMAAVSTTTTSVSVAATMPVNSTVTNQGTTNMKVGSYIKFYLSADTTITTADVAILFTRFVSPLPGGGSSSGTTTVTVPKTMNPGTYYLGACADSTSVQLETDETNNCLASTGTLTVTRDVDLIMSAVSKTATSVNIGTGFVIDNTEKNQGTTGMTVSSNTIRFYLSLDNVITSSDLALTSSRLVPALAAGASSAMATTVSVPKTTAPGTYYVGACADATLLQPETTESNNCLGAAGTLTVIRDVDLIMYALSTDATSVSLGSSFTINSIETNQGTTMMSAPNNSVHFYLSTDATITSSDIKLTGARVVTSLDAGASSTGLKTVTVPLTVAAGTYYIGAIADATNAQPENNETNNWRAGGTITVTP